MADPTDTYPTGTLLRGLLEAFAAQDVGGMEATLDEDVTWHAPGTNRFSGQFRGRPAVLDRLAQMREAGISSRFDVHDIERSAQSTRSKLSQESVGVDNRAARHIHHQCPVWQ